MIGPNFTLNLSSGYKKWVFSKSIETFKLDGNRPEKIIPKRYKGNDSWKESQKWHVN